MGNINDQEQMGIGVKVYKFRGRSSTALVIGEISGQTSKYWTLDCKTESVTSKVYISKDSGIEKGTSGSWDTVFWRLCSTEQEAAEMKRRRLAGIANRLYTLASELSKMPVTEDNAVALLELLESASLKKLLTGGNG